MEKKRSNRGESSISGFTDAVDVEDAIGTGWGEDGASSYLEYGESNNLEVIYDSWHMFEETLWATTLSHKTFEEKTMWSCFQLCYLFPKNYEFYQDDINQIWMAQGVIPVDDSAHMYFRAFQEMSIFQFSCLDCSTGGPKYKLNHSIVDLLQKHPDDKFCRVDDEDFHVSVNTLHSSVVCSLRSESFSRLCKATKLCTLMTLLEHGSYIEQVPRDLFMKLQYLRVLDFSHTSIRELPSTVRSLKDLRYLNLSQTLIKTLPQSICGLQQMQTLKLSSLKLTDLPKGLRRLKNLRYLDVDVACLLVSMPPGLGDLIELRGLPAFVVGKEDGHHINELKHMVNLHGALQILRLENVSSAEEAKEAWLNKKTRLKKLEFQWTDLRDGYDILQNLEPHTELKELQVLGYGDVKFPEWIGSPRFSKLVTVSIHDCPKCELLPPLGTLPFLKDMSISEMHKLKTIDGQFYGRYKEFSHGNESAGLTTVSGIVSDDDMPSAFLNLESFTLNGMPKLEQWIGTMKGDFPKLKKLHIFGCCMLKALPQFPLPNSLHRLEIRHCPFLEDIPKGGLLKSLKQLIIIDCPLVKQQFQRGQGKEWRNLAHIPNVWIDYLPVAHIREMEVPEEEEEANGNREESPPSEIELLEAVLDQVSENESALQLETEAAQHSEIKSAQAQKIQSVDSSKNTPGHSSQKRMRKGQKSGPQKMGISCWNKRKVRKSGGKKTALACWKLFGKYEKGYLADSFTWSKDLGYLVKANNILEDQWQLESGSLSSSNSGPRGTFVGVYDGHGGPEAARYIKENLFNNVQKFTKENPDVFTIRRAYAATEAGFLELVEKEWTTKPQIAAVGSSCLVGIIYNEILHIANVGDSRVVLGRRARKNKGLEAIQLSVEHNANIESVRRKMHSLHPDDPQIVVLEHGIWRVKGLIQLSRSIGDAYLKNAKFNREPLYAQFRLHEPFQRPILSSEPSVFVTKLKPEDLYLIFASDGLWEYLSNAEVVDIVDKYPRNGIARRLVKEALKEAAKKRKMRYSNLAKMDRGVRRNFHDDITVIVVFLDSLMSDRSSRETRKDISTVRNIPDSSKTERDTCCPTLWKFRVNTSKTKSD